MATIKKCGFIFIGILCMLSIKVHCQIKNVKPTKTQMHTSELLINSTVKIESMGESPVNGQPTEFISTSTAFFYLFKIDSLSIPVLVTNFHSINNTVISKIIFTQADSLFNPQRGNKIEYVNENFRNLWIKHPSYDLAILPLIPIMEQIKKDSGKNITFIPFAESSIPDEKVIKSLSAIEQLLMIGYPKGYSDSFNNYPIVRKGTSATPLFSNFDNKNEFLLDIPIYSGSSGSPVVLLDEGSFNDNGSLVVGGSRVLLVGIVTQSIDIKAPTSVNNLEFENPLNIAVVIKASALLDFKPILWNLIKQQQIYQLNELLKRKSHN